MKNIALAALSVLFFAPDNGIAAPISIDAYGDAWEVFHYRNSSGPNSFGRPEEDRLIVGLVNVVPNGKGEDDGTPVAGTGTGIKARQGGTELDLTFFPTTVNPNQYGAGIDYDTSLTGSWEITLTNDSDTLVVSSPEVGSAPKIDRVTGLRIVSGADTTSPTFSWESVSGIDAYKVSVYDLLNRNEAGGVDRIYVSDPDGSPTGLSHRIPDGVLSEDGLYSIEVRTNILRTSGTNPSGSSQTGAAISINRTYFDFTLRDLPTDGDIYLPEVDVATGSPIFNFDNPVLAGEIAYYDPIVAIGYDYHIGVGDPFFGSFALPDIGDGLFDLYLYDDSISDYLFEAVVSADTEYFFDPGGADRFRILGIETGLGLDPTDPTAFVTALSFVDDGRFTGTMTPITEDVPEVIPLPVGGLLLLTGLGSMGLVGKRRRRA